MTFLGQSVYYWLLFLLAVVCFTAPYVCYRLERRAERLDRAAWARMPGARL